MSEKSFLYVGHYIDTEGNYILKVGCSANLQKRRQQHNKYYKTAVNHPMKEGTEFVYDWYKSFSANNIIKYEDRTRNTWKSLFPFQKNDRFVCKEKPSSVTLTIRKEYEIPL